MRHSEERKVINRRVIAFLLIILMLVAAVLTISTIRKLNHKEETRQVEVSLYGYRTSGNIILQDTNGQLWEIEYTDMVTSESIVLLEVTGYDINRVFLELPNVAETVD